MKTLDELKEELVIVNRELDDHDRKDSKHYGNLLQKNSIINNKIRLEGLRIKKAGEEYD